MPREEGIFSADRLSLNARWSVDARWCCMHCGAELFISPGKYRQQLLEGVPPRHCPECRADYRPIRLIDWENLQIQRIKRHTPSTTTPKENGGPPCN
jgi:hypothetical protein